MLANLPSDPHPFFYLRAALDEHFSRRYGQTPGTDSTQIFVGEASGITQNHFLITISLKSVWYVTTLQCRSADGSSRLLFGPIFLLLAAGDVTVITALYFVVRSVFYDENGGGD